MSPSKDADGSDDPMSATDAREVELLSLRKRLADLETQRDLGLTWRQIPEAVEEKLVSEIPVLVYEPSLDIPGSIPSVSPHVLIEGDNLHALHVLQATHRGQVDAIYIDPPYNTGNEFRYNDKIIDKENPWRHSAWLSFMSKRLSLARELLTESGVIVISIDDNEHARLRLLCDEVFGASNFVVSAPTVMNLKGNQDQLGFAGTHEYTIVYARDIATVQLGKFSVDEEAVMDEWQEDEHGWWKQGAGLKATGEDGQRSKRPNLWYAMYVARDGSYVSPVRKKASDDEVWPITNGQEMSWRWSAMNRRGCQYAGCSPTLGALPYSLRSLIKSELTGYFSEKGYSRLSPASGSCHPRRIAVIRRQKHASPPASAVATMGK